MVSFQASFVPRWEPGHEANSRLLQTRLSTEQPSLIVSQARVWTARLLCWQAVLTAWFRAHSCLPSSTPSSAITSYPVRHRSSSLALVTGSAKIPKGSWKLCRQQQVWIQATTIAARFTSSTVAQGGTCAPSPTHFRIRHWVLAELELVSRSQTLNLDASSVHVGSIVLDGPSALLGRACETSALRSPEAIQML